MPHALVIREWVGSSKDLAGCVEEYESPTELAPLEVEVSVRGVAVNFADNLVMQGKYQIKPRLPYNPGSDWSGEISRVGSDVKEHAIGDRVFGGSISGIDIATYHFGVGRNGYSELLVCPHHFCRRFPANITYAQASMIGVRHICF
jgi:NADPH:quinone reductase-like Zn-dependent oxidoreductase